MSKDLRVDPDAVRALADRVSAAATEIAAISAAGQLAPATNYLSGSQCGPALHTAAEAFDAALMVVVTELHELTASISASAADYRTSDIQSSISLADSARPI